MTKQQTILFFTRYPLPGASKTRLIPALGSRGAADIHRQMTQLMLGTLLTCGNYHLKICYAGGTLPLMRDWLGDELSYSRQTSGDLGERMREALISQHQQNRPVCLVGSDCPHLSCDIITEAFSALFQHDLVIGPSYDGGYYLIGCSPALDSRFIPTLFKDITWGDECVLDQTIQIINRAGKSLHLLPRLHDIDTPEDLRYFSYHPGTE